MPKPSLCSCVVGFALASILVNCGTPSKPDGRSLFEQIPSIDEPRGKQALQWQGRAGIHLTDFDKIISADTLKKDDFPGWVTQKGLGEPGLLYRSKRATEPFVSELGTALAVTIVQSDAGNVYVCDVLDDDQFRGQQLAANFTAPLAYLRKQGDLHLPVIKAMLRSDKYLDQTGLYRFEPVDRNRIPVIFVHGLKSSPSIWKIMVNELRRDPRIRERYQFWSFSYPTGLPILYSAKLLRDDLNAIRETFNPKANHSTWDDMILIGHSMGGLVARLQVTNSGNACWESSTIARAGIQLNDIPDDIVRTSLVFESLPFVNRVIFMATPHGGSDIAVSKIGRTVSRLIQIPSNLTNIVTDVLSQNSQIRPDLVDIPTSIDNLNPDSMFIRNLKPLPINTDVSYHSIIASGGPENTTRDSINDGLVIYSSASLEGADSEKIVPSGHRAPNHPDAVAEVARILRQNLKERP